MDGKLAVIGPGSIGSMSRWQASRLSDSVVGFEAQAPGHAKADSVPRELTTAEITETVDGLDFVRPQRFRGT